jgi:plasmid stability protein
MALKTEVPMPAITVKNIPDELYEKLKEAASNHHRSLNSELIYCLETVLAPQRISALERIRAAREVRPKIGADRVSCEEIQLAIDQGRP